MHIQSAFFSFSRAQCLLHKSQWNGSLFHTSKFDAQRFLSQATKLHILKSWSFKVASVFWFKLIECAMFLIMVQPKTKSIFRAFRVKESFQAQDKVSSHEKLVFRSGVRFLFLFVLTDTILLKLDLHKRTSVLDNPQCGKLFV